MRLSAWLRFGAAAVMTWALNGCGGGGGTGGSGGTGGTGGSGGTHAGTGGASVSTGGSGGAATCVTGNEGCDCYGNNSCNGSLSCYSHLCVLVTTDGGTGGANGTGGAGGVTGTAGSAGAAGRGTAGAGGASGATGGGGATGGASGTGGAAGGAGATGKGGASGSGGAAGGAGATGKGGASGTGGAAGGAGGSGGTAGAAGAGSCPADHADCDLSAANGCEIDIATDPANCGSCGTVCGVRANAVVGCANKSCTLACNTNYADCNQNSLDGCEVNTNTDKLNCGSCGSACASTDSCVGGHCISPI